MSSDGDTQLSHYLALSLSLPERAARALGAIVGGGTLLLTKTLVPTALKNTNSYEFTVGMFQTFLTRHVAKIDDIDTDVELQSNFAQRKLLGTSFEAAGLLTMHLSPVWVFAIASDAARGGQVFLARLVDQIKQNEVISADRNPENLEQVLEAIHDMSRRSAVAVDTPPMSKDEIKLLADDLRQSAGRLTQHSSELMPDFETIWNQIGQVAKKENLSIEQVMGMLSVHAATLAENSIGTVNAVGRTGYGLVDEVLLDDYRRTLNDIASTGALTYIKQNMQPFVANAHDHFNLTQENRSQRWFREKLNRFGKLVRRVDKRK